MRVARRLGLHRWCILVVVALSCGYSLDLGTKSGTFAPHPPPTGLALARLWHDASALCASGRQSITFDHDGQLASFLLPLDSAVGLLAVADGASGLDTTLALYGPQEPDGDFPLEPAATSDDSGQSRSATISYDVGASPGLYLLTVSTFGGVGRGDATLTVAADGKLGCSRCIDSDSARPFSGCDPESSCDEPTCELAGVDWTVVEESIGAAALGDPCAELPTDLVCLRRAARHGDDWPARADRRIAHADAIAGGLSADRLEALRCLSLHPKGGLLDIAPLPGSRAPGDVRPALELTLGASVGEVDAALSSALGPLLGRLTGLTDGFTVVSRWTSVDGGVLLGRYYLGSYRGIPFARSDAFVASVRLLPTDCETSWVLDTLSIPVNTLESALLDEALAADLVSSPVARTTALLACGSACSVPDTGLALTEPTLVFAQGRLVWRFALPCSLVCSSADGMPEGPGLAPNQACSADGTCEARSVGTCTWNVDALTGTALDGARDCCGACDAVQGECGDACAAPCAPHEWRCPANGSCYDATADLAGREGYGFCRVCLGLASELCACYTPRGARADGEPCWAGDDVARPGVCVGGLCQADELSAAGCADLERQLRTLFDAPAYRSCQSEGECLVVETSLGCAALAGDPTGVLGAGGWPTFEKLRDMWFTGCPAWRETQLGSQTVHVSVAPICVSGRCLADDEVCR